MLFVVAAALIDADGRVLLAQRPEGKALAGLWEFPGGKVAADETPEQALKRELREELGILTSAGCFQPITFVTHPLNDARQPDVPYTPGGCDPLKADPLLHPDEILLLMLYACRRWHGTPESREGQALRWLRVPEMRDLPMPPADVPLVAALRQVI
jgi:8-oxo-dGTP diphosphatase